MNLYNLTGQYLELLDITRDPECEFSADAIRDTLGLTQDNYNEEVKKCCEVIKTLEADEDAIDKEIARLYKLKENVKNRQKLLRQTLTECIDAIGVTNINAGTFRVRVQNNPPHLNIRDNANIPPEFYIPQAPKLNNKDLLQAIKNGLVLPGVELTRTRGVRIS